MARYAPLLPRKGQCLDGNGLANQATPTYCAEGTMLTDVKGSMPTLTDCKPIVNRFRMHINACLPTQFFSVFDPPRHFFPFPEFFPEKRSV